MAKGQRLVLMMAGPVDTGVLNSDLNSDSPHRIALTPKMLQTQALLVECRAQEPLQLSGAIGAVTKQRRQTRALWIGLMWVKLPAQIPVISDVIQASKF